MEESTIIILAISMFFISILVFIFIAWFALRRYYGVNDEIIKDIQSTKKFNNKLLPLTFYLKSRGWGLSFLRIPFGFSIGSTQNVATVELREDKIVLTWIKREELAYSKLKLVDVYNLGVSLNIIFHVKGRISTRYGNIVKKQLLIEVLKILKSKGIKLSNRAEKIIKSN